MGTVQLVLETLQPAYVDVVPSLCVIATVYPVIAEPPSAGATQVIVISVPVIAVFGAAGTPGPAVGITAPLPDCD